MASSHRLTINFDPETAEKLSELANKLQCSKSEIVNTLVQLSLKRGELNSKSGLNSELRTFRQENDFVYTDKFRRKVLSEFEKNGEQALIGEHESKEKLLEQLQTHKIGE